ncbi:MAG: hypothetical protein H6825_07415 [Planctomycetes bacterium]|nr:hypothetical protein [Planctomycetota bacterium]
MSIIHRSFHLASRPLAALLVTGLLASTAFAAGPGPGVKGDALPIGGTAQTSTQGRRSAPEIDVSLAGAAAVLVVGGLLLLTDRRRVRA